MTALLLDASVVLAAFDGGATQQAAAAEMLTDESITVATIDLARYEVTNVVVRVWKAPELVPPLLGALDRIEDDGGIVRSSSNLLARAAELADRHGLSAYDAAYVAVASETGRTLVSCDVRDLVSKGLAVAPVDVARSDESGEDAGSVRRPS